MAPASSPRERERPPRGIQGVVFWFGVVIFASWIGEGEVRPKRMLGLARRQHVTIKKGNWYCEACRRWMLNRDDIIEEHNETSTHQARMAVYTKNFEINQQRQKDAEEQIQRLNLAIKGQEVIAEREELRRRLGMGYYEPYVYDPESGHMYHHYFQHYYDNKSKHYWGKDPPGWTLYPDLPFYGKFENAGMQEKPDEPINPNEEKEETKRERKSEKNRVLEAMNASLAGRKEKKMLTVGDRQAARDFAEWFGGAGALADAERKKVARLGGSKRRSRQQVPSLFDPDVQLAM